MDIADLLRINTDLARIIMFLSERLTELEGNTSEAPSVNGHGNVEHIGRARFQP